MKKQKTCPAPDTEICTPYLNRVKQMMQHRKFTQTHKQNGPIQDFFGTDTTNKYHITVHHITGTIFDIYIQMNNEPAQKFLNKTSESMFYGLSQLLSMCNLYGSPYTHILRQIFKQK